MLHWWKAFDTKEGRMIGACAQRWTIVCCYAPRTRGYVTLGVTTKSRLPATTLYNSN
jgi:hypothetical protein